MATSKGLQALSDSERWNTFFSIIEMTTARKYCLIAADFQWSYIRTSTTEKEENDLQIRPF